MTSPFETSIRPNASLGRSSTGTWDFIIPGAWVYSLETSPLSANEDRYVPWFTDSPMYVDSMQVEITTVAGTNFRIGFYSANRDWQPVGAPKADSGNLSSASTGVKNYSLSPKVWIPPGRYLSVINCDNTPQVRGFRAGPLTAFSPFGGSGPMIQSLVTPRTFGAFPTPGQTWSGISDNSLPLLHCIVYGMSLV